MLPSIHHTLSNTKTINQVLVMVSTGLTWLNPDRPQNEIGQPRFGFAKVENHALCRSDGSNVCVSTAEWADRIAPLAGDIGAIYVCNPKRTYPAVCALHFQGNLEYLPSGEYKLIMTAAPMVKYKQWAVEAANIPEWTSVTTTSSPYPSG